MEWAGVHDLVLRAKAGDAQARDALCRMAQPFLARMAEKLLGPAWPERSVRDLVNDAWVPILAGLDRFQGGGNDEQTGATFRAWLATTLRRVYLNDLRYHNAQGRRPPGGLVSLQALPAGGSSAAPWQPPAGDPTPSEAAREREGRAGLRQDLRRALAGLDPTDRYIVEAKIFDDLSFAKIAAVVGQTCEQVRYRFHKTLEALKPTLRRWQ
jgi:RNA polymerase sigma factor (sigma-70 family)